MNKYKEDKDKLIKLATQQQMSASNPNKSVWVEASAGTGKTKVLSDRVLRLLLAKVAPSKILCLTYTKAAAVEMNERITNRLSNWAIESNKDLEKDLSKLLGAEFNNTNKDEIMKFARTLFAVLLDTPGGMKIQTIHSFCQDILKRFPIEAGISPYFEVMDDRSSKDILQSIKVSLLKQVSNENDSSLKKAIIYLTQNISESRFPLIMNMITENRGKINALLKKYNNDVSLAIKELEKKLDVTLDTSFSSLKEEAMSSIDEDMLNRAIEVFSCGGKEDQKRANFFRIIKENNFSIDTYDVYNSIFFTDKGTIRARLASKEAIKIEPNILEFMNNEAKKLAFYNEKLIALKLLQSTSSVLYIAEEIISNYNLYKSVYSALDYEDLIITTKNLLENNNVADWVLFKLDGGIDHILIDEAQDTSPNQWAIVKAITQEFFAGLGAVDSKIKRTVFVVGDRKQSIYSFQGADPKEFDKMYEYFDKNAQDFEKVHLDVSFRSTKAVMDCVNLLFDCDKAKKGVLPNNEKINHIPFRLGDGGVVEIAPLLSANNDDDKNDEEYNWKLPIVRNTKTSASTMLAKLIASNIKKMVENKEILASKNRPINYGDFMFLVQQRNIFVEEFVRACKEIGVNVAGVDKLKLLEQIAVQDLISLGKFLLLPTDDLSLAEALKSPIFGLNDDDLFELCYNRKGTLFESLLANQKYTQIANELKNLLNMVGFARPYEIYNFILSTAGAREKFVSRIGLEVEDVLDEFLNLTIIFEQNNTPSLETFISWIVKDEVIVQKEMEQGTSNTVKIMTVHGSKGLQAPIVILADTTKTKNKSSKSELLWDDNIMYFPTSADNYESNCKRIKDIDLEASLDEYRRLLYVALTRAEDRLYIAGYTKQKNLDEDSWYALMKNNLKSNIETNDVNKIVYEIPQVNEVEASKIEKTSYTNNKDYSFILTPAPIDMPLAKPLAPSKADEDDEEIASSPLIDNGKFYKRGSVIHKLLQYICDVDVTSRRNASIKFLEKHLPDFSQIELNKIIDEVLLLCNEYSEIFSQNSMAEVPIIGEVDGKIISAKIDRLVITDNAVIIVDYKTNRPSAKTIADVPKIYIKQMALYKSLLQKIYPDKIVETYLLWTNTCNLMKI
ncbi:MAG: double-strand break repair helicase AddA [Alphaproteobacteria bacterium]|nr:double-strand break repair helicase AddA [Alphaproteobacteria bacterium]